MSKADLFAAKLEAQLGEPYVLGDEGPNTHDCSGLHWEGLRAANVLWKGKPLPRETAHDYYLKSVPTSWAVIKVGDPIFFLSSTGHAYHVASYVGHGFTIEARGRKWGVVKYALDDPVNGVIKRKGRPAHYPGVDLGELTEEDDMTEDEVRKIVDERLSERIDVIFSDDVAEAQERLVDLGLLVKPRAHSKAASVGFVALMISRALSKCGK